MRTLIVRMQAARGGRIELLQTAVQGARRGRLFRFELSAQFRITWRSGEQTAHQHFQVQPSAADEQHRTLARLDIGDRLQRQLAVTGAVERLIGIDDVEQVMRHPGPLRRRRLGAADVEIAIHLARVGVDDLRAQALRDL